VSAKKVTIKDVAEAAGVSVMTVSRVINDRPDVSRGTRRHIQAIIDEMGYKPSTVAQSLIRGRSNTLGVVSTGIKYFGPSRTLAGIEQQINELGYSLLLNLLYDAEHDRGEASLNSLLARQVDGILWAVPEIGSNREWLCERAREIDTPVVFLNMEPRDQSVMAAVNNYQGGRLATEHLLAKGYRRIGIIAGPVTWWEAQQREMGWRDALQEAGAGDNLDGLWVAGDWTPSSGETGLRQLLEQSPDLDAVFASNDQMALGTLQAARQAGRRVPGDLGVVGFDDIPEAAYFYPPLTTIRQNLVEMGREAVRLLIGVLQAQQQEESFSPEVRWITPELVVRESSNGG